MTISIKEYKINVAVQQWQIQTLWFGGWGAYMKTNVQVYCMRLCDKKNNKRFSYY